MGKVKIGSINHLILVKGDANLLKQGEILVSSFEGYTILRKRATSGKLETSIVIPLEEFKVTPKEEINLKKESAKKKTTNEDNK